MLAQNRGELGEERDLADGGARLGCDAVRRRAAAAPGELMADVDDAGGEVDVVPAEAEYFREPHACVGAGDEQRPVSARAGSEETSEFCAGEDALLRAERVWPLVALKPVERMRGDVATAKREGEHAAQGTEDPFDRPGRSPSACNSRMSATTSSAVISPSRRRPSLGSR